MGNTITSTNRSIKELFTNFYKIPAYQRAYRWGPLEIKKLVEDLYNRERTQEYFLGTMVTTKDDNSSSTLRMLVDGQQRITSILILYAALKDEYKYRKHVKTEDSSLCVSVNSRLKEIGQHGPQYRLDLGHPYQDFFETIVETSILVNPDNLGEPPPGPGGKAEKWLEENVLPEFLSIINKDLVGRRLATAYLSCRYYLGTNISGGPEVLEEFFWGVDSYATIVEIHASTASFASKTYETMNSRGIRLSPLETYKGNVFQRIPIGEYDRALFVWQKIQEGLNVIDSIRIDNKKGDITAEDKFLQSYMVFSGSNINSTGATDSHDKKEEDTIIPIIRAMSRKADLSAWSSAPETLKREKDPINVLSSLLEHLMFFKDHSAFLGYTQGLEIPYVIDILRTVWVDGDVLNQQRAYVVAAWHMRQFLYRQHLKHSGGSGDRLNKTIFELVSFCTKATPTDVCDRLNSEYTDNFTEIFQSLHLQDRKGKGGESKTKVSADTMRYILRRLNAYIQWRLNSVDPARSLGDLYRDFDLEHIHPKSAAKDLPGDMVTSIGNLTLLEASPNRSQQATSVESKVDTYSQSAIHITRALVVPYKTTSPGSMCLTKLSALMEDKTKVWTADSVATRARELAEIAQEIWVDVPKSVCQKANGR